MRARFALVRHGPISPFGVCLHLRPASETKEIAAAPPARALPRRALVCAAADVGGKLCERLKRAGYEAQSASPDKLVRAANEFAPDVVLLELRDGMHAQAGVDGLALAAQLRAAPTTHALPLVLLFHTDAAAQREAARQLGVDDYCALATPPAELQARLAALLWRNETGRRAAALSALAVSAEIDDFMRLLEQVRADIAAGTNGALALVAHAPTSAAEQAAPAHALAAAHEFFKLNLRRLDMVAFYGPTMFIAYLPRKGPGTASSTLAQLRNEFVAAHAGMRLFFGLATFPADGRAVETLVEHAEAALMATRGGPATQATAPPEVHQASKAQTVVIAAPAELPDSAPVAPDLKQNAPDNAVERRRARAVRESKPADMFESSPMPATGAQYGATQALAQAALAAAAREREHRARGTNMPRRLLLTVSDAARMAQVNLLLRSAGYEVRAASDAHQALNLLRIERPDLLVLDFDLHGLDGLETLRRLHQQHRGRLLLPVVLLLPPAAQREEVRATARQLGVHGFVNLPYEPAALLAAVRTTRSVARLEE